MPSISQLSPLAAVLECQPTAICQAPYFGPQASQSSIVVLTYTITMRYYCLTSRFTAAHFDTRFAYPVLSLLLYYVLYIQSVVNRVMIRTLILALGL